MLPPEMERQYAVVVARTWVDAAFKKELLANPRAVLEKNGIRIPDYMDVSVKEGSTKGAIHLGLPPKPSDISDETIQSLMVNCSMGSHFL